MSMPLEIRVISQQPPGRRCTLYAGHAEVVARHFKVPARRVFSDRRDAHGDGFPSPGLDDTPIQPGDGVILMSADVLAALLARDVPEEGLTGLAEALEAPLDRMLEEEG